eukprot:TRINITY_DN6757_c0_g2_i1.p1 TRINITY_DN6757_c0_g2~~TRINITY_DN6757_c0_g2_i1.p1  ORF type:complete len:110 (-),score=21.14 TRINITY_DN6757_c0_g2_i1:351-680(-)
MPASKGLARAFAQNLDQFDLKRGLRKLIYLVSGRQTGALRSSVWNWTKAYRECAAQAISHRAAVAAARASTAYQAGESASAGDIQRMLLGIKRKWVLLNLIHGTEAPLG